LPAQQPGTSIWLKKSTQRRKGARAQRINGVCLAVLAALRLCVKSGHEAVKGAVPIVIYSKQKSFCNSGSIFKIATRFETIRSDPFTKIAQPFMAGNTGNPIFKSRQGRQTISFVPDGTLGWPCASTPAMNGWAIFKAFFPSLTKPGPG
jgi:hypothetical protein